MESADSSTTTGAGAGTGKQPELPPGFRFHPTDEELVVHYLKRKAQSAPLPASIITDVDLYKFDPWELPAKAVFGEQEWYFFSPRDRKYPNGARPNRTATSGYWKATGIDKPVLTKGGSQKVAVKKALVFYRGKPPNGVKTDWIMHEYRLIDNKTHNKPLGYHPTNKKASLRLDDWVLCRIYKKNNANANKLNHHHHHHHPDHDESVDNMIGSIPANLSMTHHHPHDHHQGLSDGMMNGGDATATNNNLPMKQALPYLYWTDDVSMADRHTSVAVVGQLDGGFQQPYQLSSLNWYS